MRRIAPFLSTASLNYSANGCRLNSLFFKLLVLNLKSLLYGVSYGAEITSILQPSTTSLKNIFSLRSVKWPICSKRQCINKCAALMLAANLLNFSFR